ncbi:MAG: 50S ribosomal protein L19 [Candidatus Dojkabacteria bacterium]|uniref:Large ribosomal subunit protein bL19 n=2 Tax=Candidatus Dojkabacteria TaxID=74243 RepID=A0A136KIT2_9BACT|nr:MAG: 50S ribosomal protein L19 [candidate division WS6 bacterium OLB21]MBW7954040.1 50S ribosomal protein L19 [Candidatus Dojkabacteria bacterium]WKZ27781.1 MAG: 50S ribosomal protein L19 [Candidatus Dojkabacteria bacterium]
MGNLLTIEQSYVKQTPHFEVGDTIAVHNIVREGDKKRIQIFKGIVLAIKGDGLGRTFTVRKISNGIGVEKIFPLHSPNISKIEVLKSGKVRSSKIYYMRKRVGKKALKVSEGEMYSEELTQEEPVAENDEPANDQQEAIEDSKADDKA